MQPCFILIDVKFISFFFFLLVYGVAQIESSKNEKALIFESIFLCHITELMKNFFFERKGSFMNLFCNNHILKEFPGITVKLVENAKQTAVETFSVVDKNFTQELVRSSIKNLVSGEQSTTHAEIIKTILTTIVELAGKYQKGPNTNLFEKTPFDKQESSKNDILNDEDSSSFSSNFSKIFSSKTDSLLTNSPDNLPPLEAELTPYSIDMPYNTSLFAVDQTILNIDQADAWKALNLFAVGISNAYGKIPSVTQQKLNEEFIYAMLASKYPYSPHVFAGLALDSLSFVNVTQQLLIPPTSVYSAVALAKLLFLRWSDTPSAIAKTLLDYLRVASYFFAHPTAKQKKEHPEWVELSKYFRLPLSKFSSISLGSIIHSTTSALANNIRTTENYEPTEIPSPDNPPMTEDEIYEIIDFYNLKNDESNDIFNLKNSTTLFRETYSGTLGPLS